MIYRLHQPPTSRRTGRRLMALTIIGLLLPTTAIGIAIAAEGQPAPETAPTRLIINEIKSGGTNTQPAQYVTVFNAGTEAVPLEGWRIEYAKPTMPSQYCAAANWDELAASAVNVATSTATIQPRSVSQAIEIPINDNDPGSIHIVDASGAIHDSVGWGSAEQPAPCFEGSQAAQLTASKSLQRYLECDSDSPADSDNNALDFSITETPMPGSESASLLPQCVPPSPHPTPEPAPEPDGAPLSDGCSGIRISEILPNPAGSDGGHEYIELHNPTGETVELTTCSLQTSGSLNDVYVLDGVSLSPGEYRAFTDTDSNLALPNASGGTVWLNSIDEEVQAVEYPADMDDDLSWSLFQEQWAASYSMTPGEPNQATPLKPCTDNLVRNPDTNRCVSPDTPSSTVEPVGSAAASGLAACKPGQERNPATNRCRAVTGTALSKAAACKAGQERNPETNRCRAITTNAAAAKACPPGQERNPDTNRCRKTGAAAAGTSTSVSDGNTPAGSASNTKTWLIIGLAVLLSVGYGIYEWRQDIILWLKRRFGKLQSPLMLPRA